MASVIRGDDNFDTTPPRSGRVVRTSGGVTTTSTSLVDLTGATLTLTTGANPLAYGATGMGYNNTVNEYVYFNYNIDGTLLHGTRGIGAYQKASSGSYDENMSFSGITAVLTAGSHTIKEQWRVSAGTGTVRADSNNARSFYAFEVR